MVRSGREVHALGSVTASDAWQAGDGRGRDAAELLAFVVELGAAMNSAGQPVYVVQARLTGMASAYGAGSATISAFPTYLMVTMGRGEPATVELTTSLGESPRLDQIRPWTGCCKRPNEVLSARATGCAGCKAFAPCVPGSPN